MIPSVPFCPYHIERKHQLSGKTIGKVLGSECLAKHTNTRDHAALTSLIADAFIEELPCSTGNLLSCGRLERSRSLHDDVEDATTVTCQ